MTNSLFICSNDAISLFSSFHSFCSLGSQNVLKREFGFEVHSFELIFCFCFSLFDHAIVGERKRKTRKTSDMCL